jgi:hypothetical protein
MYKWDGRSTVGRDMDMFKTGTGIALGLGMAIIMGVPMAAHAKPCTGAGRLQLRWSKKSPSALVLFSATLCDTPPACTSGSTKDGTLATKAPITFTIRDSRGKTLTSTVDPANPSCAGRCGQVNRGGCPHGADTYRLAGGALRYAFADPGQTSLTVSKLRMQTSERPDLSAPVTVTVSDANGYSVEMQLNTCHPRTTGAGVAISCF